MTATPTPEQVVSACLRNWLPMRFASAAWSRTVARHVVANLDRYGWIRKCPQPQLPTRTEGT